MTIAKPFTNRIRHRIRAFLDAPAKRRYASMRGYYRSMNGNLCSSHGAILYSRREYRSLTFDELVRG